MVTVGVVYAKNGVSLDVTEFTPSYVVNVHFNCCPLIPAIVGTEKGANDLNFILTAQDFRTYLDKHFNGPQARFEVTANTTTQQIKDWLKQNGGKNGIYIVKSLRLR
jgi:hypothetical protein